MPNPFAKPLLNWYKKNARKLPWRETCNPYFVWVSEIMLQQTRVETVIPFYLSWIERFPDIHSLAEANQQDVLIRWRGLGYYGRALNLHRASQIIMHQYNGKIPENVEELLGLPGIGRYTAGAISSIAFGKDEPVLDGNIRRIYTRLFIIKSPLLTPETEKELWQVARENLPAGQAGVYNQALMDLGAMICTPQNPNCDQCPLVNLCQACALGIQKELPNRKKKPALQHYNVTAAIIFRNSEVLISQRPLGGLLGGMWEFPGGKQQADEDLQTCLRREIMEELGAEIRIIKLFGVYKHAFTHYKITLHAYCCELMDNQVPQSRQVLAITWVNSDDLLSYPMGKIDHLIANQILKDWKCLS